MPSSWLLALSLVHLGAADRRLELVQALWRHGDRAPLDLPYPNDRYTELYWPRGWGQLTGVGMAQLREMGAYFRVQYVDTGFVSANFSASQIYMRSSDSDRALVSAQAFYYGFYPASGVFRWNEDNDWQPLPIHGVSPGDPDLLCKPTSIDCANYEAAVDAGDERDGQQYNEQYADLFAVLANQTGIANFSYTDINGIFDVQRELLHNLTDLQPEWVDDVWPQYDNASTMDIVTRLRTQRMVNLFDTDDKARMMGGYLLNTWIHNAVQVSRSGKASPRMLLFSSHDGTLAALMNAFQAGNRLMVPYAAALILEVYSDNGDYFAELYYRNDSTVPAFRLQLPVCPDPCRAADLPDAYAQMTVTTYQQMQTLCGNDKNNDATTPTTQWAAITLLLTLCTFSLRH